MRDSRGRLASRQGRPEFEIRNPESGSLRVHTSRNPDPSGIESRDRVEGDYHGRDDRDGLAGPADPCDPGVPQPALLSEGLRRFACWNLVFSQCLRGFEFLDVDARKLRAGR